MAAKGRRQRLRSGDEADAASRRARKIVPFRRGELQRVNQIMNKRARREAGAAIQREVYVLRGLPH
jgi:hypothetical protein